MASIVIKSLIRVILQSLLLVIILSCLYYHMTIFSIHLHQREKEFYRITLYE